MQNIMRLTTNNLYVLFKKYEIIAAYSLCFLIYALYNADYLVHVPKAFDDYPPWVGHFRISFHLTHDIRAALIPYFKAIRALHLTDIPQIISLLYFISLCISTVFLCSILSVKSFLNICIVGLLFLLNPSFTLLSKWPLYFLAYMSGMVALLFGFYVVENKSHWWWIAIPLVTYAFHTYQQHVAFYFILYLTVTCLHMHWHDYSFKGRISATIRHLVVFATAAISYFLILKGACWFYEVTCNLSSARGNKFINTWYQLSNIPHFFTFTHKQASIIFSKNLYYVHMVWVVAVFTLSYLLFSFRANKKTLLFLLCVLIIIGVAFYSNFFTRLWIAKDFPSRSCYPLALIPIVLFMLSIGSNHRFLPGVALCSAIYLLMIFYNIGVAEQNKRMHSYRATEKAVENIMRDIEKNEHFMPEHKIILAGNNDRYRRFPIRISQITSTFRYHTKDRYTFKQCGGCWHHRHVLRKMPIWPKKGSVRIVDGKAYVKLGRTH